MIFRNNKIQVNLNANFINFALGFKAESKKIEGPFDGFTDYNIRKIIYFYLCLYLVRFQITLFIKV